MKEATKRARVFLTWNLLDFLFRTGDRRPYTRKELFQQSVEPSKMLDPEINKESRNTRWQAQILKALQERHIIEPVNEDGQTFYVLDRGATARTILEEWEDDNGMLVRALVFPNEVDFDAFFVKRVKEDNTEYSQVPMPPSRQEIDEELAKVPEDRREEAREQLEETRLADDEVEEILDRNAETKDGRFVARLVLLLTRKYNVSIATLNSLLERMIDGMGDMKSEIADLARASLKVSEEIGPRLSEVEKRTGGYNKRLDTLDRHVVDVASAVRNASRQDTGRIVADLRQVLEPLVMQQKQEPEAMASALAKAIASTLTEVTKEIQKNTATIEQVHAQQEQRQKTLQLLAKSLEANVKEAETLRLLILEQCDGR
jgi:hypothetical protein